MRLRRRDSSNKYMLTPISLENKTCLFFLFPHITVCPLARNLLMHASNVKKTTILCPLLLPIAYDSSSALVTSGGREMLIWKIGQTCTEVANLNFSCSCSFWASSTESSSSTTRGPGRTRHPNNRRIFPCTCPPLLPRVCGAIRADASPQVRLSEGIGAAVANDEKGPSV